MDGLPGLTWTRIWAGASLLLLTLASCAPAGSSILPEPLPAVTDPAPAQTAEALPQAEALPVPNAQVRNAPVRFERVLDEFAGALSGPSQVIQDRYGFIWIGTVDGLARYDGYHFVYYRHDPDTPESLSSNQVTALLEDRTGALWVGVDGGGLDQLNRTQETFVHFQHRPDDPGSLSGGRVNVIFEDASGELWVGTSSGGLNRLDRRSGTFVHYQHDPDDPGSLASNTVYAIFEDSRGELWIGTNSGLERLERGTGAFSHFQHATNDTASLSHNSVYAIAEDTWGVLWLGTYGGGLNRLDAETGGFTSFHHDPKDLTSLSSDIVSSLLVDRSGMLWVGTMGGGLNRLDPRTDNFTRYLYDTANPHSPSSSYINALFEDRAGILWVSTARLLDKFDPYKEKFTHQFRRDHVTAIYEDRDANLWVGAFDGLYKYDQTIDQVTHYRHDPRDVTSLSEWRVTGIAADRWGSLWVGTNGGGLDRFDAENERFTAYHYDPRSAESLPSEVVTALYVDRQGTLWVGTDNGLARFDRQGDRFIALPLSASQDELGGDEIVQALLEDGQGRLWIGTQGGGLKCFEPQTGLMTTYRHDKDDPGSLRNNLIYALFEDSNGVLWVGTEGGLHRFDRQTGSFSAFSVEHGLPDDEVYAILEDQSGNLWMSTDHGLSKFSPASGLFRNYDAEDGLQDNQFSSAAFRRRTGEMLFGGVNGISAFTPDQISDNPYVPPVVLLELRQDGQVIQMGQTAGTLAGLTFSGMARTIEFEFAALSYSQPERNQYAYMLEGYDEDWIYLGSQRSGRYTDLPGGSYTLRLKGANDDGVWNEDGLSARLTVVPPFWETRWFWGLLGAILIGGAVAGYRIRVVSVEARNRELEEQILERTREIERRRKELEALYQADESMHRHLNLDPLLQALVDVAVDMLHADKSAVLGWPANAHPGARRLVMRVGRGIPEHCQTYDGELAEWLAGLSEPAYVADAQAELESGSPQAGMAQLMLAEGIHSWMFLPITIQGQFFGAFNVCSTRPGAFGEHDRRLFQALVQRACLAIENARLYENAQELAAIKERNRLARDLHDSVKQKTFAALAQIGASRRLVSSQPERAQVYMGEAENLVHDVLQELVTLIQEMYPLDLGERGLGDALRAFTAQWSRQTGIRVELCAQGEGRLPVASGQAVYRVCQEALANVARHSGAELVRIELACNGAARQVRLARSVRPTLEMEGMAYLKISDDGCGFDPACVPAGVGLRSMRERVESLGGMLQLASCPGGGTCVEVILPAEPGVLMEEEVHDGDKGRFRIDRG